MSTNAMCLKSGASASCVNYKQNIDEDKEFAEYKMNSGTVPVQFKALTKEGSNDLIKKSIATKFQNELKKV